MRVTFYVLSVPFRLTPLFSERGKTAVMNICTRPRKLVSFVMLSFLRMLFAILSRISFCLLSCLPSCLDALPASSTCSSTMKKRSSRSLTGSPSKRSSASPARSVAVLSYRRPMAARGMRCRSTRTRVRRTLVHRVRGLASG